jgi:hypothetical protein
MITLFPRRARLALLVRLQARGLISDQAFLAQKRMLLGVDSLMLPAAQAASVTPVRNKHRRWKTSLGVAFLFLLGLGLLSTARRTPCCLACRLRRAKMPALTECPLARMIEADRRFTKSGQPPFVVRAVAGTPHIGRSAICGIFPLVAFVAFSSRRRRLHPLAKAFVDRTADLSQP